MSDNPFEGQDWEAFAEDVKTNLIPKMEGSSVIMSMVPDGNTDVKFAVELGFSIMLDKPIIAVIAPGSTPPAKLVKVADALVEADYDDPAGTSRRIRDALTNLAPEMLK